MGGAAKKTYNKVRKSVKKTVKRIGKEAEKTIKNPAVLHKGKTGGEMFVDATTGITGARSAIGIGKEGANVAGEIGGELLAEAMPKPQGPQDPGPGLIEDEEAVREKEQQDEFDRVEDERLARGSRTRTVLTGGRGVEDDEDDEMSRTRRRLSGS